ncbi:MAG: aspartate aminotransferase family protein [Candidatus Omnitrophica bacterium]|nr:aspartate aminotransferase family protein [Candidatus Omnitrophota bacterium]
MKKDEVVRIYEKYVMKTYARVPLVIEKAKGALVEDIEGRKYLDFFPGWAVSGIGHCHKNVASAVCKQAQKLMHVSNNYYSALQARLARKIVEHSFPGKVFFCNSGAEANEGAVKLARKYGQDKGRFEIVTMMKSFHGRTLAMIAATGQDKVKEGFEPLPSGFVHIPFGNIEALRKALSDKTAAVMLELIQCEGGINIATEEYIEGIRDICDKLDILFICDEVQTGMGRTGKMFCYQHYRARPDIMTLAKSLGGGLPIGAMVASSKFADVLTAGSHASTFGGSPIVCAAALGVFDAIEKDHLLKNCLKQGKYLTGKLILLKKKYKVIKEVRGMALTIGVELDAVEDEGDRIYRKCMEKGLLINCTQKKVLRIMPPLTVTKPQVDRAVAILDKVLKDIA